MVSYEIQSNLSIVVMLQSGHLVIADNFSWNQPYHGQTLIEKHTFTADSCYSGHKLLAPHEKFKSSYPFIADAPYFL